MAPTRIGLVLGDPAGVGPEIAAKLLKRNWDRDDLRFIVIGTEAVLAGGARVAGIDLDLETIRQGAPIPQNTREPLLMTIDETDLDDIPEGKASRAAGLFALRSLQAAVEARGDFFAWPRHARAAGKDVLASFALQRDTAR